MGATPRFPAQAGQSAPAEPVEQREPTLAERLNEDADRAELDEQNRATGDVGGDQPSADAAGGAALDPVAARFDKLERQFTEREAEHKMERQMLLGALNRQQQPPVVQVQQPPAPEPKPAPPTEEQLLERLKADPLGTIRQLIADTSTSVARATEERLRGEIKDTNAKTTQQVAFQDRMRQGALAYQQGFADVLQSDQGQAFDLECGREIVAMYGDNWRDNIQPDGPMNAASRVYTRWVREGKLAGANGSGHTNANGGASTQLREVIRRPPTPDRVTGSSGAPRGGSREPSTIGELGLNATEERAARRVMTSWGLDERTWVRNYLAAKQDNPNFGNG